MWGISQFASYTFFKLGDCQVHICEGSNQQIFNFPKRSCRLPRTSLKILALWEDQSRKSSYMYKIMNT